jgi:hypothetical protein
MTAILAILMRQIHILMENANLQQKQPTMQMRMAMLVKESAEAIFSSSQTFSNFI